MLNSKRINRSLVIWWAVIVGFIVVGYSVATLLGEIPAMHTVETALASIIPWIVGWLFYLYSPGGKVFRYVMLVGYFFMYIFILATGWNVFLFTYILAFIALVILYRQKALVACIGIVTMVINIVHIVSLVYRGEMSFAEDMDTILIRLSVLLLIFVSNYIATDLYDKSCREIDERQKVIEDKNQQVQTLTLQTIETIANTIDAKDEYTKGHSTRVAKYSAKIAEKMGMSPDEVLNVRYIALLHDIGKVGIPDSVLNKPGKLTDDEYEVMKTHTVIGGEILKDVDILPGIDQGALYHHERYDGRGYPQGLKGEEIPLIARIIGMADAFDAMNSNRVYRKHLSRDIITDEIKRCSGTQFDPKIAELFMDYLENEFDEDETETDNGHSLAYESSKLLQKIVEERSMQSQVEELTGTYYRAYAERHVTEKMADGFGCLIMADLDNLRYICRKYGFRAGNVYLVALAKLLKGSGDEGNIVSHFSGDEFLAYIPGMYKEDEVRAYITGLMDSVQNLRETDEQLRQMSVSIGAAIYDREGMEFQTLLGQAEKALYHIEQDQRGGYYLYDQGDDLDDIFTRADLNALLREIYYKDNYSKEIVLTHKEFYKVYDFVYDLIKGYSKDLRLILFTTRFQDEAKMDDEEKDAVMTLVEDAIRQVMKEEKAFMRYSSTQRIVVVAGEESGNAEQIAEAVGTAFSGAYGKDDAELTWDIASIKDSEQ